MNAIRVNDRMTGNVSSHSNHIVGWTSDEVPQPIYCTGHGVSGHQTGGSNKTFVEGKLASRINDNGSTNCPCDGQGYNITSGSSKVFIEGRQAARKHDRINIHGHGAGSFVSSSAKVFIGG